MRVAAIYDIHGNLPALEAVLAEIAGAGVDAIVIGGDVLPGPLPCESLTMLAALELPVHCLRGNGELAVLEALAGREPAAVPEQHRASVRWVAEQLTRSQREWIAAWPRVVRLTIDGLGEVLFCHATPRNEMEIFTKLTPEDRLLPIFANLGADVAVCGHTHMKFDRRVGAARVVQRRQRRHAVRRTRRALAAARPCDRIPPNRLRSCRRGGTGARDRLSRGRDLRRIEHSDHTQRGDHAGAVYQGAAGAMNAGREYG
jgi:predicted phosphodiesterase